MRRQTFMGWLVRCLPAHDGLFCRIGYLADRHDQCLFLVMWGIFNWGTIRQFRFWRDAAIENEGGY